MQKTRKFIYNSIQEKIINTEKLNVLDKDGNTPLCTFDIKDLCLQFPHVNYIARCFLDRYKSLAEFQVGGVESSSIPLITAITILGNQQGKNVNGFYIRKERKRYDLMNIIEGKITSKPIILVDDIINSGESLMRSYKVLESSGHSVYGIWTILMFKNMHEYVYFISKKIFVSSMFSLDEFTLPKNQKNICNKTNTALSTFNIRWCFKSNNPSLHLLAPKSSPTTDHENVYFGTDNSTFWSIKQKTGEVNWRYRVGRSVNGKSIFSSPIIHNGVIYFGSYDGNLYALDSKSGYQLWVYRNADWIGSSPDINSKNKLIFVIELC